MMTFDTTYLPPGTVPAFGTWLIVMPGDFCWAGRCDLRPPMSICSISTRIICSSEVGIDLTGFWKILAIPLLLSNHDRADAAECSRRIDPAALPRAGNSCAYPAWSALLGQSTDRCCCRSAAFPLWSRKCSCGHPRLGSWRLAAPWRSTGAHQSLLERLHLLIVLSHVALLGLNRILLRGRSHRTIWHKLNERTESFQNGLTCFGTRAQFGQRGFQLLDDDSQLLHAGSFVALIRSSARCRGLSEGGLLRLSIRGGTGAAGAGIGMGYLRCFRLPRRLRSIMARSF